MRLKSRIIEINGETFSPGYTFEEFKNSSLYDGQDGVRIIRLKGTIKLLENNYIASLFFRNNVLYMLSFICIDVEFQFEEEIKRKQFHDSILKKMGWTPSLILSGVISNLFMTPKEMLAA